MVRIEKIVLKNSSDAISCSAVLYCTARITQIDAVGIAMVITEIFNDDASVCSSDATPIIASGNKIFLANVAIAIVRLNATW